MDVSWAIIRAFTGHSMVHVFVNLYCTVSVANVPAYAGIYIFNSAPGRHCKSWRVWIVASILNKFRLFFERKKITNKIMCHVSDVTCRHSRLDRKDLITQIKYPKAKNSQHI